MKVMSEGDGWWREEGETCWAAGAVLMRRNSRSASDAIVCRLVASTLALFGAATSATRVSVAKKAKPGQEEEEDGGAQAYQTYELMHLAIEAAGLDEVQHLVLRELLRRVRPVSQGNDQHKRTQHNTPNQSETENETETERLRR
jgi:hypothetical protein